MVLKGGRETRRDKWVRESEGSVEEGVWTRVTGKNLWEYHMESFYFTIIIYYIHMYIEMTINVISL